MGQGGGREGELLKKMTENFIFRQKIAIFLTLREIVKKISQKC